MYCISVVSNYKNINYAINILSTSCYARKENFKSAALTPLPRPHRHTVGDNRCINPLSHKGTIRHCIFPA